MCQSISDASARAVPIQLDGGRHFFNEQPKGSDLYKLPEWQLLLTRGVLQCNVDMCMGGLRSRRRSLPLKKPSELWASHWLWVARFENRLCDGRHSHDTIAGGEQTFANLDVDICKVARRRHRRPHSQSYVYFLSISGRATRTSTCGRPI